MAATTAISLGFSQIPTKSKACVFNHISVVLQMIHFYLLSPQIITC